ncbi:MAG TPA: hypothetical protein VG245_09200 [Candidatus Dormibacteraeota bacterium]|nr:hypothetical protein [Candidatus Dormibacteraeota bacterium]
MRRLVSPLALARHPTAPLLALIVAALGCVAVFDLGAPLAFNDDWVYAWSARNLSLGRGLHPGPEQAAAAVFHQVWATVLTLAHPDQRLLRLSILPLAALTIWCVHLLAKQLGASQMWSVIAAASFAGAPLFLSLSTTYMTDVAFTALLTATAAAGTAWIQHGRMMMVTVALAALAILERQTGVAIVPAMAVGLWLASRRRPVTRTDILWFAGLCAAALTAFVLPVTFAGGTQRAVLGSLGKENAANLIGPLVRMPTTIGLFAIPLLGGLLPRLPTRRRIPSAAVLGVVGALYLVLFAVFYPGNVVLPGDYFGPWGIGPPHVLGHKPTLIPRIPYAGLEVLCLLAAVAMGSAVRQVWRQVELRPAVAAWAILGLAQLAPAAHFGTFDRYYLPLGALAVPLGAAAASRRSTRSRHLWAIGAVALGVGFYVIGEQDYQAWQGARDQAARLLYTYYSPGQVDAGFEANGTYFLVPLYDAHGGQLPGPQPVAPGDSLAVNGPAHPCAKLRFAAPGAPGPGYSYWSLAPGRVVLRANPGQPGCPAVPSLPVNPR